MITKLVSFTTIPTADCGFSYRTSKFATTDKGRYFITAITIHLIKTAPEPPFYSALQRYFEEHKITRITVKEIRDAVINIRQSKLPDPNLVANAGSFFKNPIVDATELSDILVANPEVEHWDMDDGRSKLSAAWLIQQVVSSGVRDSYNWHGVMAKTFLNLCQ